MPKKPSEWTPQEAWDESAKAHYFKWRGMDWAKDWGKFYFFPFPADPVERVSDEALNDWSHYKPMRAVQLMALELIERRKAEKEPTK